MQPHRHVVERRAHLPSSRWLTGAALLAAASLPGCRGSGDASQSVASVPSRSGDVWEADSTASRAAAPATLLAFVNGVHVVLLDGADAYAGTQALESSAGEGTTRTLHVADGLTAQLVPVGDALDMRFSSGEHVLLRKRGAANGSRP